MPDSSETSKKIMHSLCCARNKHRKLSQINIPWLISPILIEFMEWLIIPQNTILPNVILVEDFQSAHTHVKKEMWLTSLGAGILYLSVSTHII